MLYLYLCLGISFGRPNPYWRTDVTYHDNAHTHTYIDAALLNWESGFGFRMRIAALLFFLLLFTNKQLIVAARTHQNTIIRALKLRHHSLIANKFFLSFCISCLRLRTINQQEYRILQLINTRLQNADEIEPYVTKIRWTLQVLGTYNGFAWIHGRSHL